MSFASLPSPDMIRIEVREMMLGTVVIVAFVVLMLVGRSHEDGEEFLLTLPAGAPQANPGDKIRLRATADDGVALEGDFVVARASGAWLAVRRR